MIEACSNVLHRNERMCERVKATSAVSVRLQFDAWYAIWNRDQSSDVQGVVDQQPKDEPTLARRLCTLGQSEGWLQERFWRTQQQTVWHPFLLFFGDNGKVSPVGMSAMSSCTSCTSCARVPRLMPCAARSSSLVDYRF